MKPYKQFKIGDVVEVKSIFEKEIFSKSGNRLIWNIKNVPTFVAYYVGYKYRFEGHSIGFVSEDDSIRFISDKSVLMARLKIHSRGKEYYAPFESLTKVNNVNPDEIFRKSMKWPDDPFYNASKQGMREYALQNKRPNCGSFRSWKFKVEGAQSVIEYYKCKKCGYLKDKEEELQMRMWCVNPKYMCHQHLLGEHVEAHMFVGAILKGKDLSGYIKNGLVEIHHIKDRHHTLAEEMLKRGYNHNSPLPDFQDWIAGDVDVIANEKELERRRPNCGPKNFMKK